VWRFGAVFARVVGVSALIYAALVGIEPSLAPGLDPTEIMDDQMDMGGGATELTVALDDEAGDAPR